MSDGAGKRQIYDVDKSLKLLRSFWSQPGWNGRSVLGGDHLENASDDF